MRVLFAGKAPFGSYQIRAVQIARQREDWTAFDFRGQLDFESLGKLDACVAIKYGPATLVDQLRRRNIPIVLDMVDNWGEGAPRAKEGVIARMQRTIRRLRPDGIIFTNRTMMSDLAPFNVPCTYISHHYRPDAARNPVRARVGKLGYEGGIALLGEWRGVLEQECQRRGWKLVLNPRSLSELDIGVAVRGAPFDGYADLHWKSHVKLVNYMATGTPCALYPEPEYVETAEGCGIPWFSTPEELSRSLDALEPYEIRKRLSDEMIARSESYSIENVSQLYEPFLAEVLERRRPGSAAR